MVHHLYMQRAIQLAKKALGNTYPNPLVGCVIVYNNKIIGEGWHHKAGEFHAEINAINSVKDKSLLPHSTLYVTLEPCSHYGKTPPCSEKIVQLGIPKVVIGTLDPHDKVNGKGKAILENAGVEVITNILEKECQELNKRFFTFQIKKRPFIVLKWAQSKDGFIDKDFKPYSISNKFSQQINHQLRANEDAILVGTTTVIRDNPSLTVREVSGNNPARIIIDKDLKIPQNSNVYNNEVKTFIINSKKNEVKGNIHFITIDFNLEMVSQILHVLFLHQIQSVIVEGGSFTLQQFINSNQWDEAWIFENNDLVLENGTKTPNFSGNLTENINLAENQLKIYKNQ